MFTIIIPTHDRPVLLQRTLRSLLAQTYTNFQVIIVSDSATYLPPYQELQALQGRYTYVIRTGTPGPAESRNMGLKLSQPSYIIFLDDDDTFEPTHLASLAQHIQQHAPEIAFCSLKICYEDRTQTPPATESISPIDISSTTKQAVFIRNQIPNSCLAYRHDIATRYQHRSDMRIYEDWDYLMLCLRDHELSYVAVDSVLIHKSPPTAPENMRRGNSRHDLTIETMLDLYKNHPSLDMPTRLGRQALLASAGLQLGLEYF